MEQFPNHELEYVVDDYYDITDFEDDSDSPRIGSSMDDDSADSDFEDDFDLVIHFVQSFRRIYISNCLSFADFFSFHSFIHFLILISQQIDPRTDTSAVEVKKGKDIQGIPWERLNFTREEYRESRLKQYKNYESLSLSREDLEKVSSVLLCLLYFGCLTICWNCYTWGL